MKIFNRLLSCLRTRKPEPDLLEEFDKIGFDADCSWTLEVIQWVADTNDPILLAETAALVNSWAWPEWLPECPHTTVAGRDDGHEGSVGLRWICDFTEMCRNKADVMVPGISQRVRLSGIHHRHHNNNALFHRNKP